MKKLILILTATTLFGQTLEEDPIPELKKTFTYFNAGVAGFALGPFMPNISVGWRRLNSSHVFDRNIGIAPHPRFQVLYGQLSYLFYPTPSQGPYFGVGLTGGIIFTDDDTIGNDSLIRFSLSRSLPYLNLPFTLGYQFTSHDRIQFIQLQATPLVTGSVSYGISF